MDTELKVKIQHNAELQQELKRSHDYLFQVAREIENSGDLERIRKFEPTDQGNMYAMEVLFPNRFCKNKAFGVMVYNGKCWDRTNAEDLMFVAAMETLRIRHLSIPADSKQYSELSKKSVRNVANANNLVTTFAKHCNKVEPERFNSIPFLFHANNGVIDLRSGQLLEHDYEYYATSYTKVDYVQSALPERWLNFLRSSIQDFDNEEVYEYIHKLFGYLITGETNLNKIIYLYGSQGRNGKGTVTRVLETLLGNLAATTNFATFTRDRENDQGFDIAPLYDKRVVIASESSKNKRLNEAQAKTMSGGDKIPACFKHQTPFDFLPVWKIVLASNHIPKGDVDDTSFWERFWLVPFPNSFYGREDLTLKDDLCSKESLEAILYWCVEGAYKFYSNMRIQPPTQFVEKMANYRDENDTIKQWLNNNTLHMKMKANELSAESHQILKAKGMSFENLILQLSGKKSRASYPDLHKHYSQYCEDMGEKFSFQKSAFNNSLRNKGYIDKGNSLYLGKVQRCFEGIYMYPGTANQEEALTAFLSDVPNAAVMSHLFAESE